MHLYEVAAAIAVAGALFAFAARRNNLKIFPMSQDRIHLWTTVASSLFVAIVAIAGLVVLSSENLAGTRYSQLPEMDHSSAIHDLYFAR